MELNQLKYFKAVADSGKITSAAKELYLSPAAISSSIAALEQELDVELFHRTGNRLTLNRQGTIFLDYANHILESVSDAKSDLLESLNDRKKNIVIGATSTGIFSDFFCDFARRHPDIPLTISQIPLRYINSAGLNSRFSFLFSTETETPKAYANACNCIQLFTDSPSLLVHPDHPLAKKDRILPEDLLGRTLIWPRVNHGLKDLFLRAFAAQYLPQPVLSIQHLEPTYAMVKNNLGIALLSVHSKNIITNDLVHIPVELANCSWKQNLYWKKDMVLSAEDKIFIDFVKVYYSVKE